MKKWQLLKNPCFQEGNIRFSEVFFPQIIHYFLVNLKKERKRLYSSHSQRDMIQKRDWNTDLSKHSRV